MQIDHIGYAVRNINKARISLQKIGYDFEDQIFEDEDRNLLIQFGTLGDYRIELVQILDASKKSPIDAQIKRIGATPYHLCYSSNDLESEIRHLDEEGFMVVEKPAQAIAFGGARVVFLLNLDIGLIEIVEKSNLVDKLSIVHEKERQ